MSYQNQKPYIQANTIISFINSVRAFAIRNPSPEEQSLQSPSSYEPQVSPTTINATLNYHEPQSPVSNPPSSLPENSKPVRIMEEIRENELEISLEQTLHQQEPYEAEPGYQTPPEHNEEMDMSIDTYDSHDSHEYTLPYSYLPEPSAGKYHSMLTRNWSILPAPPPSPVPRARRRNIVKPFPLAPPSPSLARRTKRYNSKGGIPSSPPLAALKPARKGNAREGIPHAPRPPPARIAKGRKGNGTVEMFGETWPPDESRIISLLTDSSSSSRAASPAPASPTSDSDIIITYATPIRHKEPPPPSKSSSLSIARLIPLPKSSSVSLTGLSPLPMSSSSSSVAGLSPLPMSSSSLPIPPLLPMSSTSLSVLSPLPMSSSPPMAVLYPLPMSSSPPMAVLYPLSVSSSSSLSLVGLSPLPVSSSSLPSLTGLSPFPISSSPPLAGLSPLKSSSLSPSRLSPPLRSFSLSPASSKFNSSSSSSSSSSSDELTIPNTSNKRPPHHPHYSSPKRQRVRNVRLKSGPWGDKDRMLLVKSLQEGIDFITLGQKMQRDVDDVFEKFSDVVAAGLCKCSMRDSSTQTDEMVGEER